MIDAQKVDFLKDINQIDLTAGQYIDVGCRLILHPYAGLRWAQVDRDLDAVYVATLSGTASSGAFFATRESSDFDGIGPIAGIDATWYIYMGFGAVAHFDSALLVGDVDSHLNVRLARLNLFGFDQNGIPVAGWHRLAGIGIGRAHTGIARRRSLRQEEVHDQDLEIYDVHQTVAVVIFPRARAVGIERWFAVGTVPGINHQYQIYNGQHPIAVWVAHAGATAHSGGRVGRFTVSENRR